MPTNTWELFVTFSSVTKGSIVCDAYLSDAEAFDRVVKLLDPERAVPQYQQGEQVCFKGDERDPKLAALLALLKEQGLTPAEHSRISIADSQTLFRPFIERTYAAHELDESPYLSLRGALPSYQLADDYLPEEVVESLNLPEDRWNVWILPHTAIKRRLGELEKLKTFVVNDEFMHLLKAENLNELAFREMRYLRCPPYGTPLKDYTYEEASPEEVKTRLWALSSEMTLPPCLLRRQSVGGALFVEPDAKGGVWDDACHDPAELTFNHALVEKMTPFDIAVTQEWIGPGKPYNHPELIVSQKFRSVLAKHKIKGVSYTPVRLVD